MTLCCPLHNGKDVSVLGHLLGYPHFLSLPSQHVLGRAHALYRRKISSARGRFCLGC